MSVNTKMTAIADAIRAKTGGTGALTLDGMATAIAGIETGGKLKSASGTCGASGGVVTVTGLDFRPYAVMVFQNYYNAAAICNANGATVAARATNGGSYIGTNGTFTPTDGGFVLNCSPLTASSNYTWHAIGM